MELTIEQALQQGLAFHKAGKLKEAEGVYRAILQAQPGHPDVNHNLAVLLISAKRTDEALTLFKAALQSNPKTEQFWLSYLNALITTGNVGIAKQVLKNAEKQGFSGEKFHPLREKLIQKKDTEAASPSQQQLNELVQHYQSRRYEEAQNIAEAITEQFPNHQFSWKVLGAVLKQTGRLSESLIVSEKAVALVPQDAEAHISLASTLKELGRSEEAEASYRQAISLNSDLPEAHMNLGNLLKELDRLEEAEASYRKAIVLKSDFAAAYNNLGSTQQKLGKLEDAEKSYMQAIALNPNNSDTHYNLGNTLNELRKFQEAEVSYKKAIALKSDFSKAYSNLGNMLHELGRLEEAEENHRQAIVLSPNNAAAHNNLGGVLKDMGRLAAAMDSYEDAVNKNASLDDAKSNLITCLTLYAPLKKGVSHPIIKVNEKIREINLPLHDDKNISDEEVIEVFLTASTIMKDYDLNIKTQLFQIYRRNSIDLNCKRHKFLFDQHDIIPRFCFGCYKIQVEPKNILELIKLYMVFDHLKLEKNNIRKCLVEVRPEISGFYKGLIYCSDLNEAIQIKKYIDIEVKKHISSDLSSKIKRGCSEYSLSFPDYEAINETGPQLMNYNKAWSAIEEDHDRKNPIKPIGKVIPTLSGFNLEDLIIMQKWIDYAKGIKDKSVKFFNEKPIIFADIYELAKQRINS